MSLEDDIDFLERVHPRDLHVSQERDDRDLVHRFAALGLVPPDRRAETDAEFDHAHAEGASCKEVTTLVNDHQDGEAEDSYGDVQPTHRRHCYSPKPLGSPRCGPNIGN